MSQKKSKNYFINWFSTNKNFLSEAQASQAWDRQITEVITQKAIVKSKKAQLLFCYTESKIAFDYAKLINFKLREAFAALNFLDFSEPDGFAEKKKASPEIERFFEVRRCLEFFIKEDICQHSDKDSQLNALRRWINIAERLFNKHCYEGYFLVMTLLQTDKDLNLTKELPKFFQSRYQRLCELSDVSGNFRTLREEIKKNEEPYDFIPVSLMSKDLTSLNSALEQSYIIKEGHRPRKSKSWRQSFAIKTQLLEKFMLRQSNTCEELPAHLQLTYQQAYDKFKGSFTEEELSSTKALVTGTPTLFHHKGLLPPLMQRKCSAETFWQELYGMSKSI